MLKRFSFLGFCCLALCSFPNCKQEPVQPAPAPWEAAPGFLYNNRIAFNSAIWDDQLYVLTGNALCTVKPDGNVSWYAYHKEKIEFQSTLNRDFFVVTENDPDVLIFISSANPNEAGAKRIRINMSDLGSDIAGFAYNFSNASFKDNGAGQVLANFRTTADRSALFLFDVKMKKNAFWEVDEVSLKRINLPESNFYNGTSVIGDKFLIRTITGPGQSSTLLIDATGNVTMAVSELGLYPLLPIGDTLYAHAGSATKYTSTNQGNSWVALQGQNPGLDFLFALEGYTTIDSRLVMHSSFGIYQIERSTEGKISTTLLDLTGLEGNSIINLHEWSGQVFAVTLTGVYIRNLQDFFTKREY